MRSKVLISGTPSKGVGVEMGKGGEGLVRVERWLTRSKMEYEKTAKAQREKRRRPR
jgi:hypothetical protein